MIQFASGEFRLTSTKSDCVDTSTAFGLVTFYGDSVASEAGQHDLHGLVAEVVARLPDDVREWLLDESSHLFIGGHGQYGEFIDHLLHPKEFEDGLVRLRIIFLSEQLLAAPKEEAFWTIAHEIAHSRLDHGRAGYDAEIEADRLVKDWGFQEPKDRPRDRERYRA